MTSPPKSAVLDAFGVAGPAQAMPGGRGTSWRAGGLVLKPAADDTLQAWLGDEVVPLPRDGFRLAEPVGAGTGRWTHDGWSATREVEWGPGPDGPERWPAVLAASRAFHRATARLARPPFLDDRDDVWAVADRVAWGEREMRFPAGLGDTEAGLRRIADHGDPEPDQLVHGDLTGNVLFAPSSRPQPPAIIDVSPYWRPPSFADGVVVADAMCWHGASVELCDLAGVPRPAVARALLFRLVTSVLDDSVRADRYAHRYRQAATALET